VYKLNRGLYGLKQSASNFSLYLQENLDKKGFIQRKHDACLFLHPKMIFLVYVDDCILFAPDRNKTLQMIEILRDSDLNMELEQDMVGFLGFLINKTSDGKLEMLQTGLIDRIISVLGIDGGNEKETPAKQKPLVAEKEGEPFNETFSYPSVVGMLL